MPIDKAKLKQIALKSPELAEKIKTLLSLEETSELLNSVEKLTNEIKELLSQNKTDRDELLFENKTRLEVLGLKKGEVVNGDLLLHFSDKVIPV